MLVFFFFFLCPSFFFSDIRFCFALFHRLLFHAVLHSLSLLFDIGFCFIFYAVLHCLCLSCYQEVLFHLFPWASVSCRSSPYHYLHLLWVYVLYLHAVLHYIIFFSDIRFCFSLCHWLLFYAVLHSL